MNFRTSHLVGLVASAMVVLASTSGILSAAEPLNITGPDGESRQTLRQYGPTTASDTFWSIAQKTRPDSSVTIYQVMAAIFDANPHAFSSDNYNSLEKGMILLIPSKEVMQAIPKSLAKQQAQNNDRGWRQAQSQPKPQQEGESRQDTEPQVVQETVQPVAEPKPLKVSVEQQKQIEELTAKLESEQAKNLSLTDELARAQDKLNLGNNDSEMLQAKIDEQNTRIAELEEALLIQKEQKAELNSEIEQLRQQLAAATQPVMPKAPDDSWRTMMSNPLYIGLAAAIPALLLLVLVWLAIKRRSNKAESEQALTEQAPVSPEDDAPKAPTPEADEEVVAVHLDADEEAESLDSLMSVDEHALKPEAGLSDDAEQLEMAPEMVVDTGEEARTEAAEEEGQSLDDLWAEAMGEQEESEEAAQEDDLDSLLAELDQPEEAPAPASEEVSDEETDLDELLADFEAQSEPGAEDSPKEEDLDALLAEFDLPEVSSEAADNDVVDENTNNDAASETPAQAEDLTDAIAEELADAVDAGDTEEKVDEEDLDALLAGFDSDSGQDKPSEEQSDEDLSQQIAAELEETQGADEDEGEQDLDALLSGLESPSQADDGIMDTLDEAQAEEELQPAEESSDAGSMAEPEAEAPLDTAAETESAAGEEDTDKLAPLEFESIPAEQTEAEAESDDDVALDALLADLESADDTESEAKHDKSADSGFFDDLKGNKRTSDSVLEWESALASEEPGSEESLDEDDDAISLQLPDDDNLTVDEALAALDAAEKKKPAASSVAEHDLTAFQQDNGFIDIDRLLNEADEEQLDVDQYKELDVDMGELDDLMGNATMVDVDDEENAVNAKLDLARAYIEIDDIDSAKALLKEVELDGNERQQQEAKTLLDEL